MATALPLRPRPLMAITHDLSIVNARLACARAAPIESDWTPLEDRQEALRDEFDRAVYAFAGVGWDILAAVRGDDPEFARSSTLENRNGA